MIGLLPDMTPWMNSKMADTAPEMLTLIVIVAIVVLGGGFLMLRYLASQTKAIAEQHAKAVEIQATAIGMQSKSVDRLADAVDNLKTRDDSREERHFAVLEKLGLECNRHHEKQDIHHAMQSDKLEHMDEKLTRIESHLGKAKGA